MKKLTMLLGFIAATMVTSSKALAAATSKETYAHAKYNCGVSSDMSTWLFRDNFSKLTVELGSEMYAMKVTLSYANEDQKAKTAVFTSQSVNIKNSPDRAQWDLAMKDGSKANFGALLADQRPSQIYSKPNSFKAVLFIPYLGKAYMPSESKDDITSLIANIECALEQ